MENMTISGGTLLTNGTRYTVRIKGQFKDVQTLKDIVVHSSSGAYVKLSNIADVVDGFKEQESFARLDGKNVITLNVIKKSGANLLDASDQIKVIVQDLKSHDYPKDMEVTITGDQSRFTRNTLEELNNTIIIGFILVTIVLMFFMGFTNAFFVGLSVPLSIFVAYLIIPGLGYTMNMIVMFAFIFALGIVVDDAIVVIENTHRLHRFNPDINIAAKKDGRGSFPSYFIGNADHTGAILSSGFLAGNSWPIYALFASHIDHYTICLTICSLCIQSCICSFIYETRI